MPAAVRPKLLPGKVYRTSDLARYGKNPTRLAQRLVAEGELRPLAQGLYVHSRRSKFGPVPPTDTDLMRRFLQGSGFLLTGPDQWNALGLGSTALFPTQLVYNRKRTGDVTLGGRQFRLRRVQFPKSPTSEYFAVDLIKNHRMAGVGLDEIGRGLERAVTTGRLDPVRLRENAEQYGTKTAQDMIERATAPAAA